MVQVLARLSCGLSKREREALKAHFAANNTSTSLAANLGQIIILLESIGLIRDEDEPVDGAHLDGLELSELEKCAQELVLPYLRIASLIIHYYFEK